MSDYNNENYDNLNYQNIETNSNSTYTLEPPVKANIPLGMLGAIIGSLLGVALWILIDRVGFIAGISGVVMLLASFKGYTILGRRLDRFGTIFCIILSFIMIFVAVNLTILVEFYMLEGAYVFQYPGTFYLLKFSWQEPDILMYILKNLAIGYGLYIWAGYSHIKKALQGN